MLQPWIPKQVALVCFQGICVGAEANSKADQAGEETAEQGEETAAPDVFDSAELQWQKNHSGATQVLHCWRPPGCVSDRGGATDPALLPFSQSLQEEICLSETFFWKLRPEVAVS